MATTTTLNDILFKIAHETGGVKAANIRTVGSQTSLTCTGLSSMETDNFIYGIASVFGKGVRQITGYREADDLVTLASSFDSNVSVGDVIQVAFFDPTRQSMAINAANEAINMSYPYYYRETKTRSALTGTVACSASTTVTGTSTRFYDELVVGDVIKIGSETGTVSAIASQTSLTLSAALTATTSGVTCYHDSGLDYTTRVHQYALPSTVHELLAIGYALSSDDPVRWIPPLSTWRVIGTEGAYLLDLFPNGPYSAGSGSVDTAYASPIVHGGTLADVYNGKDIQLHYATREPELTSFTDVTNIPLQYFAVASKIYAERRLMMVDPESPEGRILNNMMPVLMDKALSARGWLYRMKEPLTYKQGPKVELR